MPQQPCAVPYSWTMTSSNVLAHRFNLPEPLEPFTSLTVRPGQTGLAFINGEEIICREEQTHVLTGDVQHNVREAIGQLSQGGKALLLHHGEITLFDTRLKALPKETIQLKAANNDEVFAFLNLVVQVGNVRELKNKCSDFTPCADGSGDSELTLDAPLLRDAFAKVVSDVTTALEQAAAQAADQDGVYALLADHALLSDLRRNAERKLLHPLGLVLDSIRLTRTERACPYCSRQLSVLEIRGRRCQSCGCALHHCPGCNRILRSDQAVCPNPNCGEKLLWCGSKGCETFRRPERGRFCPVCRGACYPPKQLEFFRNE